MSINAFQAFRIQQLDKAVKADFTTMDVEQLTAGDVVVKVAWSGVNYKDALAATGAGKILRAEQLNGGIDFSGEVVQSEHADWPVGARVLVCGAGLSETLDGGYAQYARVPSDALVAVPESLSLRDVMGIGTAGFTAALAVHRMQQNGQTPDLGPILITGATGGVGSVAIDLLNALGFEVVALSGKSDQADYLHALGAKDIISRHDVDYGRRPLERALWGGAVDSLGGEPLTWLTRTVSPWGNIASVGLAAGHKLETTVMPFILRGVSLLGINSIDMPASLRRAVWARLGDDLKPSHLKSIITREVALTELPAVFDAYLQGAVTGRTVVRISGAV